MADLFEYSRRRFMQLGQIVIGSGVGILFSERTNLLELSGSFFNRDSMV